MREEVEREEYKEGKNEWFVKRVSYFEKGEWDESRLAA
jgi:hypothetical protein